MADISTYIEKLQNAVYGEEVRGAIIDALNAINEKNFGMKNKTITFPEDGIVTPIDGTALYIGMASTDVNILRDKNTNTKITCDVIFLKGSATQLIVNRDYNISNHYFDLSSFTTYDRIIVHFTNGAVTVSKGI